MITYQCAKCGFHKDRLVRPQSLKALLDSEPCPNSPCDGTFNRMLNGPASVSKIIVGQEQAKAVEIMPDIEELMEARAAAGEDRGFGQPSSEEQ